MKEVKSPKKPLIFYYGIALLVIVLFNVIVSPLLVKADVYKRQVEHHPFSPFFSLCSSIISQSLSRASEREPRESIGD